MHIFVNNKYISFNNYKVKCSVGKRGIRKKKKEGDLITPKGSFKIKNILYRKDRIKNIVHMGVIAYGWTFVNRKLDVPEPTPYVVLDAPSGQVWEWNDKDSSSKIEGAAVEFAQVVTQVRNFADTQLSIAGKPAEEWMKYAQCFAGPPEDPPAKGTRYKAVV